jgi:hypothetical protein
VYHLACLDENEPDHGLQTVVMVRVRKHGTASEQYDDDLDRAEVNLIDALSKFQSNLDR